MMTCYPCLKAYMWNVQFSDVANVYKDCFVLDVC